MGSTSVGEDQPHAVTVHPSCALEGADAILPCIMREIARTSGVPSRVFLGVEPFEQPALRLFVRRFAKARQPVREEILRGANPHIRHRDLAMITFEGVLVPL